jgi:hypothetical protein
LTSCEDRREINQIEAGTIKVGPVSFLINDILTRLSDEFEDHAEAKSLRLRVVASTPYCKAIRACSNK